MTTRLLVDTDAIAANTRLFAILAPGDLMAVVKAQGYGAGAELVARTALGAGASRLGVTSITEALALRLAGLEAPILSWLNPVDADFEAALDHDIDLAVPGVAHLDAICRAARRHRLVARVHLQIDCGLAREGCPAELWPQLLAVSAAAAVRGEIEVVGIMGHLSSADDPADPANRRERTRFAHALRLARAAGLFVPLRHLAATSAALTQPGARHSLCRVGAGLVGIDPTGTHRLRGALTLEAQIVDVRAIAAGTPVGYGHGWLAPRSTRLALVAAGYADGVPRTLATDAEVLVTGTRRRIVGRVSMDQFVVDLDGAPAAPGEYVTVFGPGDRGEPTVADWARWCGTIPNEIVTGVGPRVERVPVAASTAVAAAR
ncbi:alanine racemase [Gryllotalpicola protaetiae]|uniref:Alanine racemase n=1 Tax=Gryllotalpicola protaetiae TaxID=2419771 RepID=A0A387BSN4_9MICO|nr:alanine racemase [Gryllotalpicola protaetiae]AYG05084.1 alanine racemase [Gryllotalpicola protaetiae]